MRQVLFNAHLQMDFAFMLSVTQDLYEFYRFLCQHAFLRNKHCYSVVQHSSSKRIYRNNSRTQYCDDKTFRFFGVYSF